MNPLRWLAFFALGVCALHPGARAETDDFAAFQVKEPNGVVRCSKPIMSGVGEEIQVFNPTVIPVGNRLAMLYRTDVRNARHSRIHLAYSDDGRHFSHSEANPVLCPSEPYDAGGCEDPRVVKFGETYYLTYVGDRDLSHQEQCLATSTDLVHWEKKGVVLKGQDWGENQMKAGVIVPEKIGGKYVMYFIGEKVAWHTSLGIAFSDDLLHWSQPLDHPIMEARPAHFDSLGVEPGATPLVLPEGVLLIYNGWNDAHVHKTGWVLFARDDPSKILKRCEQPFIEPEFPYERPNAGHLHLHRRCRVLSWFVAILLWCRRPRNRCGGNGRPLRYA